MNIKWECYVLQVELKLYVLQRYYIFKGDFR